MILDLDNLAKKEPIGQAYTKYLHDSGASSMILENWDSVEKKERIPTARIESQRVTWSTHKGFAITGRSGTCSFLNDVYVRMGATATCLNRPTDQRILAEVESVINSDESGSFCGDVCTSSFGTHISGPRLSKTKQTKAPQATQTRGEATWPVYRGIQNGLFVFRREKGWILAPNLIGDRLLAASRDLTSEDFHNGGLEGPTSVTFARSWTVRDRDGFTVDPNVKVYPLSHVLCLPGIRITGRKGYMYSINDFYFLSQPPRQKADSRLYHGFTHKHVLENKNPEAGNRSLKIYADVCVAWCSDGEKWKLWNGDGFSYDCQVSVASGLEVFAFDPGNSQQNRRWTPIRESPRWLIDAADSWLHRFLSRAARLSRKILHFDISNELDKGLQAVREVLAVDKDRIFSMQRQGLCLFGLISPICVLSVSQDSVLFGCQREDRGTLGYVAVRVFISPLLDLCTKGIDPAQCQALCDLEKKVLRKLTTSFSSAVDGTSLPFPRIVDIATNIASQTAFGWPCFVLEYLPQGSLADLLATLQRHGTEAEIVCAARAHKVVRLVTLLKKSLQNVKKAILLAESAGLSPIPSAFPLKPSKVMIPGVLTRVLGIFECHGNRTPAPDFKFSGSTDIPRSMGSNRNVRPQQSRSFSSRHPVLLVSGVADTIKGAEDFLQACGTKPEVLKFLLSNEQDLNAATE
eukprot:CAMPEP_0184479274 /NCGR_PEP_ID=MMETSP0113_2-20130426/1063_1 /TAXON_ID=91329 /ORGANISM="Norrisiella sphaerica, Strain BC52" /LENGTH=689 /DNA_ID=CAMNT_0026857321 /DNA_START=546 /DNA_END=2612 /DNA_ORIENTATION=-